jgi:alkylresorcinol/alkylpyrone synthase
MDAVSRRLGLANGELRWSRAVLSEFGNVSSASLYFVLEKALSDSARGGWWWLSSFGAGFSCHGALVEVE